MHKQFDNFMQNNPSAIKHTRADGVEFHLTFDEIKKLISPFIFHDDLDNEKLEPLFEIISIDGSMTCHALFEFLPPAVVLMQQAKQIAEYLEGKLGAGKP